MASRFESTEHLHINIQRRADVRVPVSSAVT